MLSSIKFLIVLVAYNRPKMILNALESIRDLQYDNWHLALIDDGSDTPIMPIALKVLGDKVGKHKLSTITIKDTKVHYENATFYRINDSKEDKRAQGGSRHPEFMNRSILESDLRGEDVVIVLCDDDALVSDYLSKLNKYYLSNPTVDYSYCHLIPFNPYTERPTMELAGRSFWLNHGIDGSSGYSWIDGSQSTYRKRTFTEGGIRYPSPAHRCLDAAIHESLARKYGILRYNGVTGQFKGDFDNQLGKRNSGNELEPVDGRYEG